MDKDTRIPGWIKDAAKENWPFDEVQHRVIVKEMNAVARLSAKELATKLNISEPTAEAIIKYIWQNSMYVY